MTKVIERERERERSEITVDVATFNPIQIIYIFDFGVFACCLFQFGRLGYDQQTDGRTEQEKEMRRLSRSTVVVHKGQVPSRVPLLSK
jgi:hypothetical protein